MTLTAVTTTGTAALATALFAQSVLTTQSPLELSISTITVIVAGIVTILGAITTGVLAIIAALKTNTVATVGVKAAIEESVKTTVTKLDDVQATTRSIDGHVNSAATKAAEEIRALRTELELMRVTAAKDEKTAALLAQAALTGVAVAASHVSPPIPVVEKHLKNIDDQTAEVAENTKAVEAKVDSLKEQS